MLKLPSASLAVACLVAAASTASFAQSPSPSPSASPALASSPKPARTSASKDIPPRIHRALVMCDNATFWSWPSRDSAPSPASYPPARQGDSFNVIGEAKISYDNQLLYETTIDVVAPWGAGAHYWIAASCVNAA